MDPRTTDPDRRDGPGDEGAFPAYGPIDAVLGYALFYLIVDRATPVIVETFSETVLDLSPSFVRFGLAAALWAILALTVFEHPRRQLAALGLVTDNRDRLRLWSRVSPPSIRSAGYLVALAVGAAVAAVTVDPAIGTVVSLIRVLATLETAAFDPVAVLVMLVFFVAYGLATHALDRLVVDGLRALLD
jgi:hypothetical protein